MNASVIAIGHSGVNRICDLPYIPVDDSVKIQEYHVIPGGRATWTALTTATLGLPSGLVGVLGDDQDGRFLHQVLKAHGLGTRYLYRRCDSSTPSAIHWLDQRHNQASVAWSHGTLLPLAPGELPRHAFRNADAIHLDGIHADAAMAAAEFASHLAGVHLSLDACTLFPNIERLLELADVIWISQGVATALTGHDHPQEALKAIFDFGFTNAVALLQSNGDLLGFDGDQLYTQPHLAIPPHSDPDRDAIACGAFLASYVKCHALAECLHHAATAAAMCIHSDQPYLSALQTIHHSLAPTL